MKPIYKIEKVKVDIKETSTGNYYWYKVINIHNREELEDHLIEYLENWESNTVEWDSRFNQSDVITVEMELSLNPFTNEVIMVGW